MKIKFFCEYFQVNTQIKDSLVQTVNLQINSEFI